MPKSERLTGPDEAATPSRDLAVLESVEDSRPQPFPDAMGPSARLMERWKSGVSGIGRFSTTCEIPGGCLTAADSVSNSGRRSFLRPSTPD